jgi:hypothetical protein
MGIEAELNAIEERLDPIERFIRLFSATLAAPKMRGGAANRHFRYDAPGLHHFCLLKTV